MADELPNPAKLRHPQHITCESKPGSTCTFAAPKFDDHHDLAIALGLTPKDPKDRKIEDPVEQVLRTIAHKVPAVKALLSLKLATDEAGKKPIRFFFQPGYDKIYQDQCLGGPQLFGKLGPEDVCNLTIHQLHPRAIYQVAQFLKCPKFGVQPHVEFAQGPKLLYLAWMVIRALSKSAFSHDRPLTVREPPAKLRDTREAWLAGNHEGAKLRRQLEQFQSDNGWSPSKNLDAQAPQKSHSTLSWSSSPTHRRSTERRS